MFECMHCLRKSVVWDSDFTGDEVLGNGDTDGIVHMCHCTNCGAEIQYYIPSDNFTEE